jgi:Fic family protein
VSEPEFPRISYRWSPIADLTTEERSAISEELPPLADIWKDEQRNLASNAAIKAFNERLQREWAIETGIIERLYSLDRGITQLLIEQGIDASLIPNDATDKPPELVASIIRDQESAVEFLFDLVARRRALTVGFVNELHALMTRHQETTVGVDMLGRQVTVPLERGKFKTWKNNPQRADGTLHEYCPPEHVQSEMERMLQMHREHSKSGVAPEVEAAWLHHRFTQIHPFQDGNGRIARALASLVFISAGWFPLVVTRDDRVKYLDALEEADRGSLSALVDLFAYRQKRAFVAALGVAREVTQEGQRIDQQLSAISEMFARRDEESRAELDHAKVVARQMWSRAVARFEELAQQLEAIMQAPDKGRKVFIDKASDEDTDRSKWHRWQIVQAARELGYFAGLRGFACWVRLGVETESGRSEILLSLHEVGPEYRGIIGGSMSFYRKQESAEGERQAVDLQTVSEGLLQLNYRESADVVARRFDRWLDRGLVRALDAWRRSE